MEGYPYKQSEMRKGEGVKEGFAWGREGGQVSLGFIVGILAEDNKALQDGGDREVLLCGQLCPLSVGQQHWRGVGLETCDGLWLSCLAHHVHRLEKHHTDKLLEAAALGSWLQIPFCNFHHF